EEIENSNLFEPVQEQIERPILPNPHLDHDLIPSTSPNPDAPVDDYSTFLKVMSDKDRSFNTQIEEVPTQGQLYQDYIQPITSSSGIYFDYLGSLKINKGHLKILIPLDISHFGTHIQNIKAALESTRYMCNQTQIVEIDAECHNMLQPLIVRHQDITREFESISHLMDNRIKRAWIGGIGTILKQIFGTLDENDALKYNDAIESIQNNEKQLASLMKDNILVTTSIITSYNKTLNKIKINEVNLNEAIDKLSHKLQNISELTNGLHVLSNINEILDIVKTSCIVITPQQLYRELADNYRHLPNYLELPIILDINTIHHILSVSKLICYYVDYKIIFVLQVPLVGIREYMLFHNIALPTPYNVKEPNKFSLIIPSSKYIAMTKDKSHYCNLDDLSNCKTVKPGNFICDITSVYVADSKPTCESELLTKVISEIPKQCETKFIFGELDIWKPLINNKWIFIQSKPNKISIDCAN
ncbi:fusion protein, partial [Operophtera brumata]